MIVRDQAYRAAARDNAESWVPPVPHTRHPQADQAADAWVHPQRTPRYYPDAVTLDPAAVAGSILGAVDAASPGCSIKDSFATLDLGPFGFRVIREAKWIYRDPQFFPGSPARATCGGSRSRRRRSSSRGKRPGMSTSSPVGLLPTGAPA